MPSPAVPHRPPPSPTVPHRPRPSFTIPGRPRPSPAVLNRPRPSIPLPCTNMSHPVGPAVLPKDGRPALGRPGRTTDSRPVPSGALGSPPTGPRRAPGRLGTLVTEYLSVSHTLYCSLASTNTIDIYPQKIRRIRMGPLH